LVRHKRANRGLSERNRISVEAVVVGSTVVVDHSQKRSKRVRDRRVFGNPERRVAGGLRDISVDGGNDSGAEAFQSIPAEAVAWKCIGIGSPIILDETEVDTEFDLVGPFDP